MLIFEHHEVLGKHLPRMLHSTVERKEDWVQTSVLRPWEGD